MSKYRNRRLMHRSVNGRFRAPSLERDFGLRTAPCPSCGALNPYGLRQPAPGAFPDPADCWDRPSHCSGCGKPLEVNDVVERGDESSE